MEAPDTALRETLTEHLEKLLGGLRGEALLVATLSYGLGVRVSALREVKVRDVSLADNTIFLTGRERAIPVVIREDLREYLEDKGDRSASGSRRDQKLFGDEAFTTLADESRRVDAIFSSKLRSTEGRRAKACLDSRLRILGWFHRKRAARKGLRFSSALELFDKGPRIVRRGQGGRVDAYYAWRASRVLFQ
jgi:integrase